MAGMEVVAEAIGVSIPVLQFLICFSLTVPCSALRRFIKGTTGRHAYSAVTGAVLSHYSFGSASNILFVVPILGSYASMVFYRKKSGFITAFIAFTYLISCHLYYMSGDAWKSGGIDATGALMVLTLKVTAAAMNYQDGLIKEEDLRDSQKRNRLVKLPSALAYLGYCFNCGTHLAGPVYELKDYLDWTDDKGLWSPHQTQPPPSRYGPALRSLMKTLLCMGVYVYLSPRAPLSWYSDPGYYKWGFWQRVGYQILTAFATRWKYYFIWSLAEASVILSGFGFSGWKDSKPKWDRAVNVDIVQVELATSAAALPVYWNIHVSTWLRHYVYERLIPKGKKPGFWQLLATQVVSAVWHGLYAGYLLFFVNSALMISGSKAIYRWQRAFPENSVLPRRVLLGLNFIYTLFVLNTTCVGFLILGLHETLAAYSSVYYSGTLVALAMTVFGSVVTPPRPKSTSSAVKVKKSE
ncbi:unnamed protein product [Calypogeia fissa]